MGYVTRRKLRGTILLGGVQFFANGFQCAARSVIPKEGSQLLARMQLHPLFNTADAERATYLVVGDGDLSFSAQLSSRLEKEKVHLIASVLEDQESHHSVYRNSKQNTEVLLSAQQSIRFGVDATKLSSHFPDQVFDRIIFNFPHWRGKSNNRYNRKLLDDFLASAAPKLKSEGEIHVALCRGQGGTESTNSIEWNGSWNAAAFAADHGLLLRRLEPFISTYNRSSHRGVDRPFSIGDNPLLYVFGLPNRETIEERLQIAFRHELRIELQGDEFYHKASFSKEGLENGDMITRLVQEVISEYPGVDAKVPLRETYATKKLAKEQIAFLIIYKGAASPLTRVVADEIRSRLESLTVEQTGLRLAKAGRMVSKPFPYPLLDHLVKDFLHRRSLRDVDGSNVESHAKALD